jgi:hypothetical protein
MADFVHKDVTVVVGTDTDVGITVIFIVKKDSGLVYSFPTEMGEGKELNKEDMEKFLASSPESEMLTAISKAWKARTPQ